MKNKTVDSLNRVDFMSSAHHDEDLNNLWMNAACNENKDSLNLKLHNHTFFEMHVILSGNILYKFKDREITVKSGQVLINPPNKLHCIPTQSDDFAKLTIAFEAKEDSALCRSLCKRSRVAIDMGDDLLDSLNFIIKRASDRTQCCGPLIKNRILGMIMLIAEPSMSRSDGSSSSNRDTLQDTRIMKAKKYVKDNQHIFLTCDEIARYCDLSPKQLGRLFFESTGITLLAYLHEQKISAAKIMIAESDELLESISRRLGFSSVNYFVKFFTKHAGITPGEFRRRLSDESGKQPG